VAADFARHRTGWLVISIRNPEDGGSCRKPNGAAHKWKELGRYVRKGEKALVLCMPITRQRTEKDPATGEEIVHTWQSFVYKPNWFVISQTEGQEVQPEPIPTWNKERALAALGIEQVEFQALDGNVQGYARGRQIAINPVAQAPIKTLMHEAAHVVLEHTSEAVHDSEALPRSLREAEAESVALLCLESLGMDGAEYCRGYIQNWLAGAEIPERSAQRIFACADKLLKAGYDRSAGGAE